MVYFLFYVYKLSNLHRLFALLNGKTLTFVPQDGHFDVCARSLLLIEHIYYMLYRYALRCCFPTIDIVNILKCFLYIAHFVYSFKY